MNKINKLFSENKNQKLLSLYFCAGAPTLESTGEVIKTLQRRGISMIEVGIPFSDPHPIGTDGLSKPHHAIWYRGFLSVVC